MSCQTNYFFFPFFPDFTSSTSSQNASGQPEDTPKKRRITGTKRIEFESAFAKAAQWLSKASEQLDRHGKNALEDPDVRLAQVKQIEREMKNWKSRSQLTIELGQGLVNDIQSESDYPEDYLTNVTDKVVTVT